MKVADRFKEAQKTGELSDYKEVEHIFKTKDDIMVDKELLKAPMKELYEKVEGKEIWDGFIDLVILYPSGDGFEYKLVCWIK